MQTSVVNSFLTATENIGYAQRLLLFLLRFMQLPRLNVKKKCTHFRVYCTDGTPLSVIYYYRWKGGGGGGGGGLALPDMFNDLSQGRYLIHICIVRKELSLDLPLPVCLLWAFWWAVYTLPPWILPRQS